MTAKTYFNRYPSIRSNIRDPNGQDDYKNYIKDFHDAMIDIGLIQSVAPNQLDVNNIPNIDIDSLQATPGNMFPETPTGSTVYHKALIYNFDDTLQGTHPVTLTFEYGLARGSIVTVANMSNWTNYTFVCSVTISFGPTIYKFLSFPHILGETNPAYTNRFNNVQQLTLHSNRNSTICYDNNKGYLFLNICSGLSINSQYFSNANKYPNSMIGLIVQRSIDDSNSITNKFLSIIPLSVGATYKSGNISINETLRTLPQTLNRTTLTLTTTYTSSASFVTPNFSNSYVDNGKQTVFMSTHYDPTDQIPYYDPHVLLMNINGASGNSGIKYSIDINPSESYNYITISNSDFQKYPYTQQLALLAYFN